METVNLIGKDLLTLQEISEDLAQQIKAMLVHKDSSDNKELLKKNKQLSLLETLTQTPETFYKTLFPADVAEVSTVLKEELAPFVDSFLFLAEYKEKLNSFFQHVRNSQAPIDVLENHFDFSEKALSCVVVVCEAVFALHNMRAFLRKIVLFLGAYAFCNDCVFSKKQTVVEEIVAMQKSFAVPTEFESYGSFVLPAVKRYAELFAKCSESTTLRISGLFSFRDGGLVNKKMQSEPDTFVQLLGCEHLSRSLFFAGLTFPSVLQEPAVAQAFAKLCQEKAVLLCFQKKAVSISKELAAVHAAAKDKYPVSLKALTKSVGQKELQQTFHNCMASLAYAQFQLEFLVELLVAKENSFEWLGVRLFAFLSYCKYAIFSFLESFPLFEEKLSRTAVPVHGLFYLNRVLYLTSKVESLFVASYECVRKAAASAGHNLGSASSTLNSALLALATKARFSVEDTQKLVFVRVVETLCRPRSLLLRFFDYSLLLGSTKNVCYFHAFAKANLLMKPLLGMLVVDPEHFNDQAVEIASRILVRVLNERFLLYFDSLPPNFYINAAEKGGTAPGLESSHLNAAKFAKLATLETQLSEVAAVFDNVPAEFVLPGRTRLDKQLVDIVQQFSTKLEQRAGILSPYEVMELTHFLVETLLLLPQSLFSQPQKLVLQNSLFELFGLGAKKDAEQSFSKSRSKSRETVVEEKDSGLYSKVVAGYQKLIAGWSVMYLEEMHVFLSFAATKRRENEFQAMAVTSPFQIRMFTRLLGPQGMTRLLCELGAELKEKTFLFRNGLLNKKETLLRLDSDQLTNFKSITLLSKELAVESVCDQLVAIGLLLRLKRILAEHSFCELKTQLPFHAEAVGCLAELSAQHQTDSLLFVSGLLSSLATSFRGEDFFLQSLLGETFARSKQVMNKLPELCLLALVSLVLKAARYLPSVQSFVGNATAVLTVFRSFIYLSLCQEVGGNVPEVVTAKLEEASLRFVQLFGEIILQLDEDRVNKPTNPLLFFKKLGIVLKRAVREFGLENKLVGEQFICTNVVINQINTTSFYRKVVKKAETNEI